MGVSVDLQIFFNLPHVHADNDLHVSFSWIEQSTTVGALEVGCSVGELVT